MTIPTYKGVWEDVLFTVFLVEADKKEFGNEHCLISQPTMSATVSELYERVSVPRVSVALLYLILFKIPLEVRKGLLMQTSRGYA